MSQQQSPRKRNVSPRDQEKGPTPKVGTPAAAAAAPNNANQKKKLGLTSNGKRLLAALFVVIVIIVIAVTLSYTVGKKSGSATTSSTNTKSRDTGTNTGSTVPGETGSPTTASPTNTPTTASPTNVPTAAPTGVPTNAPTIAVSNGICYIPGNIGNAKYYAAIFSDSYFANNSAVYGRLAVGGDCQVQYWGVGEGLYVMNNGSFYHKSCPTPDTSFFSDADTSLVVNGLLTFSQSSIFNGGVQFGSVNVLDAMQVPSGCPKQQSNSLDFSASSAVFTQLRYASDQMALLPSQGWSQASYNWDIGTLSLSLNGNVMQEYFTIQDTWLNNLTQINMYGSQKVDTAGTKATIIINVLKTGMNTAIFNPTFGVSGFDDKLNYIMWNFNGFTDITIQNAYFPGSVLAPDASFVTTIGSFKGSVFGKAWNADHTEYCAAIENKLFKGNLFTTNCGV
jgi:choice-of-anchor A domain-containing protein